MLENPRWFGVPARGLACWLAFEMLLMPLAAENPPEPRLKIEVVEGEGAINSIHDRRAKEPVVRVTDENKRPVAGASVSFILPGLGASGVFPEAGTNLTAQTDDKGRAAGRGLKPNNIAGAFQIRVTASQQGRTASAAITQTNVGAGTVKRGSSKKIAVVLLIAGGAAGGAMAALKRNTGNTRQAPSPPTPGTTIAPGGGSVGPPH